MLSARPKIDVPVVPDTSHITGEPPSVLVKRITRPLSPPKTGRDGRPPHNHFADLTAFNLVVWVIIVGIDEA
jgi:hypothetical protein